MNMNPSDNPNPEQFAALAERRKQAFDAVTKSLKAPKRLEPGRTYPNDNFDVQYPDCPMCIVKTCTAGIWPGSNGSAVIRVALTCSTKECQQAWAALAEAESNASLKEKL